MPDYCGRCRKWYRNIKAHFENSSAHEFRCFECSEDFDDADELETHDVDEHGLCTDCGRFYSDLKKHWDRSSRHAYCLECDRHFQSDNNLRMHLNSKRHQAANVKCPGCSKAFTSVSALTLHLETGTCPSGISNKQIQQKMRQFDHKNIITRPLIKSGWESDSDSDSDDSAVETWATNESFNPFRGCWECPLPNCGKGFRSLQSINAHLQSGCHQRKEYRCPGPHCKEFAFTRLSALVQHIESKKCGVGEWRQVRKVLKAVQNRRLLTG